MQQDECLFTPFVENADPARAYMIISAADDELSAVLYRAPCRVWRTMLLRC